MFESFRDNSRLSLGSHDLLHLWWLLGFVLHDLKVRVAELRRELIIINWPRIANSRSFKPFLTLKILNGESISKQTSASFSVKIASSSFSRGGSFMLDLSSD